MSAWRSAFSAALVVVTVALGLSACAGAPVQEMSDARSALAAAQRAGAEQKAPDTFRQAEAWLNKAQVEMEIHNYSGARDYAQRAKDAALQARIKAQVQTQAPAQPHAPSQPQTPPAGEQQL